MESRSNLLQKIMTVPMAAIAVAELLYLRWTMTEGGRGVASGPVAEHSQVIEAQKLTSSAAA